MGRNEVGLRSFHCFALRILTAHELLRHKHALAARAHKSRTRFPMAKLSREKTAYSLLNKHGDVPFFSSNFDLQFIIVLFKELEKIMCFETDLLLEMCYSRR